MCLTDYVLSPPIRLKLTPFDMSVGDSEASPSRPTTQSHGKGSVWLLGRSRGTVPPFQTRATRESYLDKSEISLRFTGSVLAEKTTLQMDVVGTSEYPTTCRTVRIFFSLLMRSWGFGSSLTAVVGLAPVGLKVRH